jgi:ribosomal-protein-alanine N-acetyltransferase
VTVPEKHPDVIVTGRLELAPLAEADLEAVHALWSSPGVRRHLFDDAVLPVATVAAMIGESVRLWHASKSGLWAIRRRGECELAGFTGFWTLPADPEPQLLYGIREELWGRGLAAEAAAAMVAYGFDVLGLDLLVASADAANVASVRVMQKLGMRFDRREEVGGLELVFYRIDRPRDARTTAWTIP